MGGSIPGEMVIIYQDAFSHFDKDNCGMVSTKLLGQMLRFVGENPSDAELQVRRNRTRGAWQFVFLYFLGTLFSLEVRILKVQY